MDNDTTPVPRLGLGTWQNTDFDECRESIQHAIDVGYRHLDTAELYENERAVGAGIAAADVSRAAVFLATKVLHPRATDDVTRRSIRTVVEGCLERLSVDTVDLVYVHWPADYDLDLVHSTLAALRDDGLLSAVGVSNYEPRHVDRALATDPDIVANQIECHPLLPQSELRQYCAETDVDVVAYAPLAHGNVFDVPELTQVATSHGVSVPRVTLAWLLAKGVAVVPKATSEAHIRDNWASQMLELSDDDIATIDSVERSERFFNPEYAPEWRVQ
jgi:2,5-diketo-D-gluconate reductase B